MYRSAILGVCAVSVASFLSGCVIVIGNEDDFDDDYHADWDMDYDEERVVSGEPILIAARDGVVTLSGDVSSARTLDRAVNVASQTPGVDSVVLKVVVAVEERAGG